jgi:hypothetical protein
MAFTSLLYRFHIDSTAPKFPHLPTADRIDVSAPALGWIIHNALGAICF